MASIQLVCPHCGSTLSFGSAISPGTPLTCLICTQTFAAPSAAGAQESAAATQAAPTATVKKAPAVEKKPVLLPRKRATATAEAEPEGRGVMLVFGLILMTLLTGGIGFGIWRMVRTPGEDPEPAVQKLASNDTGPKQEADPPKKSGGDAEDPVKKKMPPDDDPGSTKGNTKAPLSEDQEEDIRNKIADEVKNALTRKRPVVVTPEIKDPEPGPVIVAPQPARKIPGIDQKKINDAIDKGVAYLKSTQSANGSWGSERLPAHTALVGLSLLECGVPANDPTIQKAISYVRAQAPKLDLNYDVSVTVLFLDRLGDPADRPRIQGLAMRLIAAQYESGGWPYPCPTLSVDEMFQLYAFLESHKPAKKGPAAPGLAKVFPNAGDPFDQLGNAIAKKIPANGLAPIRADSLAPSLRQVVAVTNVGSKKGRMTPSAKFADNSNTQFAVLALWAARRHGVVSDQSLLAAYQRFLASQKSDGGWGYTPEVPSTGTMTNAGLLALAIGHGVAPDAAPALKSPAVQSGFQALARYIDQPSPNAARTDYPMANLYMLWSIERVAMLYDLKTIGGKDWYGWGAQILVHNQSSNGAWFLRGDQGFYIGTNPAVNTCFALLFLRRSNLATDLTTTLNLHSGFRDR